jgi:hypothetical protein
MLRRLTAALAIALSLPAGALGVIYLLVVRSDPPCDTDGCAGIGATEWLETGLILSGAVALFAGGIYLALTRTGALPWLVPAGGLLACLAGIGIELY